MKKCKMIDYRERASFYDLEYQDRSDKAMLDAFVHKAQKVLEIPCGGGRNIDLYQDNTVEATLIDIEPEMITVVKKKIKNHKNIICFVGDILNLNLPEKYDLILLTKESLQLFLSELDVKRILNNLKQHLQDDGSILVDLYDFFGGCLYNDCPRYFDPSVQEGSYFTNFSNAEIIRWSKFFSENGILKVYYKYLVNSSNQVFTSSIKLRNYSCSQFLGICKDCGLLATNIYGNYNLTPYTASHNRMIFVLQKNR